MKKMIYSEDFKNRILNAIKNNSIVAEDLWKAINTSDNVKEGVKTNYITTKRVNRGMFDSGYGFITMNIKLTQCNKDFTNDNNPEKGSPVGMWRGENRCDISIVNLIECFKSLEGKKYHQSTMNYFVSVLALNEPIRMVTSGKMEDITNAYLGSNYVKQCEGGATLQNSCMRGDETANVAGDFYANFCGAKIIIAKGSVTGEIYGRAILWNEIKIGDKKGSFVDRMYFSHDCIRVMIEDYAHKSGVAFRKYKNTYSDKKAFIDFATDSLYDGVKVDIKVPVSKWHKHGSPYLDTFSYLRYEEGQFILSNNGDKAVIATLDTTGTAACREGNICSVCGKAYRDSGKLCPDCREKLLKDTSVGYIYVGKTNKKHEPILPKKFIEDQKRLENI